MGKKPSNIDATPRGEDDEEGFGDEAEHPAEPPQGDSPTGNKPDTITITLSLEEKANAALKACEKWDEILALKEQVAELNTRKKVLEKDHALLAKQALTGQAEVAADQVDMFRRPAAEGGQPTKEAEDAFQATAEEIERQQGRGKPRRVA